MSIRSEAIKQVTTKQVLWSVLGAMAVATLGSFAMVASQPVTLLDQTVRHQQSYLWTSMTSATFALILGVRMFTDEYRNGTILVTALLTPRLERVLRDKVIVAAAGGVVVAVTSQVAALGAGMLASFQRETSLSFAGDDLAAGAGMALAGAAWAALGVAVGAVIRHQVAAVTGALLWMLVVENVAVGAFGSLSAFLPGRAGHSVAGASAAGSQLAPATAFGILTVYVAVACATALLALRHRDVEIA